MNKYTIYFELFGKRMKTEITAENETEAKTKLFQKIIFHKVEKKEPIEEITDEEFQAAMNFFKKLLS